MAATLALHVVLSGLGDKMKYVMVAFTSLVMFISANAADAATYVVDRSFNGATATGSISTDGTIGVLNVDNITDFDITVSLSGFVRSFSKSKGWYNIVGNAFSATSTALSFDGTLAGNNYFYFSSDTSYFPGVYSVYSGLGEGVQVYNVATRTGAGSVVGIAQTAGPVPEPATWAMMIVGFGSIGAALRRRTQSTGRIGRVATI